MADGSNYDGEQPTDRTPFRPNPYHREAMAVPNRTAVARGVVERLKASHAFAEPLVLTPDEVTLILYSLSRVDP